MVHPQASPQLGSVFEAQRVFDEYIADGGYEDDSGYDWNIEKHGEHSCCCAPLLARRGKRRLDLRQISAADLELTL